MHGEKDHPGVRIVLLQFLRRLDPIEVGHRDVGDDHVWQQRFRGDDHGAPVLHDGGEIELGSESAPPPL
jgi:hypothetical protein